MGRWFFNISRFKDRFFLPYLWIFCQNNYSFTSFVFWISTLWLLKQTKIDNLKDWGHSVEMKISLANFRNLLMTNLVHNRYMLKLYSFGRGEQGVHGLDLRRASLRSEIETQAIEADPFWMFFTVLNVAFQPTDKIVKWDQFEKLQILYG